MKLEKLEATGSPDHIRLSFDDGSTLRVPTSVVAELGLYAGLSLEEDDMERIAEASGKASAKLRAVRIVASAAVSEKELRRRLVAKGEKEKDAAAAVCWLSDLNLLDDGETARQIVHRGIAKGYGKARIKQMLYEKGIGREHWEQALSEIPEMDDAIDRFLSARLNGTEPDQKQMKRLTDALLRRGHSWEDIRSAFRRYSDSLEED